MPGLELCHLFLFVEPQAPEAHLLNVMGLQQSCRRAHPGQGTENICYCFDNAFLELLWVTNRSEVSSSAIVRTGLSDRANWRQNGANPFGIALRGQASAPFPTWDYKPPYLPKGHSIPVACSSGDPTQPLLFVSPGNARPDQWADGRAGKRQNAAGLSEIIGLEVFLGTGIAASPDLETLIEAGLITLGNELVSPDPKVILTVSRSDGGAPKRLELPGMSWL